MDTPTPRADSESRPVYEAFPEHEAHLRRLLAEDDDFAELCDDFDAVATAYHRGIHGNEALRGAADEYHSLRIELEAEILDWLRRSADTGSPSSYGEPPSGV